MLRISSLCTQSSCATLYKPAWYRAGVHALHGYKSATGRRTYVLGCYREVHDRRTVGSAGKMHGTGVPAYEERRSLTQPVQYLEREFACHIHKLPVTQYPLYVLGKLWNECVFASSYEIHRSISW